MLIGLTVVNFSEKCRSHRKNHEWRLNLYFVHNFYSYIFAKLVRTIIRRDFFFNKKSTPQCKEGMVKKLSSTRKMDPSARGGVVVDVVDSNLIVSDNFI